MKNMLGKSVCLAVAVLFAAAAPAVAKTGDKASEKDQLKLAESMVPSMVVVEYTLKTDKGQEPQGFSGGGMSYRSMGGNFINEERPLEVAGFLVDSKTVVTADAAIHPRFIKSIAVRHGDAIVPATISAYAVDNDAVFLDLESKLPKTKPLKFKSSAKEPYFVVGYTPSDGKWIVSVAPFSGVVAFDPDGRTFQSVPKGCVITDLGGRALTVFMNHQAPPDKTWKESPKKWRRLSKEDYDAKLNEVESLADRVLFRVLLKFRSPKTTDSGDAGWYYGSSGGSSGVEMNTIGLVTAKDRVLVLRTLDADTTARLETIRVFDAGGESREAKFVGTLEDFGGFVVSVEEPFEQVANFRAGDIRDVRDELLLRATVQITGEQRTCYYWHDRVVAFHLGRKRDVYPQSSSYGAEGYLFNMEGELVAFAIAPRLPVSVTGGRNYSYSYSYRYGGYGSLTAASLISGVLARGDEAFTDVIIPLSEEDEERMAWMGVVLQRMDAELARESKVSEQTGYGERGGLVTYVYPGSPAAKAGVEPGMILLRLDAEDEPRPIDIQVGYEGGSSFSGFDWGNLDRMPLEYMGRMGAPWPSAETELTAILTALGFGTRYTATFLDEEGKEVFKDFVAERSPPHYASADKFKSEELGLTVRDLTFEVRRYLQREEDDPGIVVSKVEPGTKAAIAGIRPYEVLTHLNEEPLVDVKQFEAGIAATNELDLSVSRMTSSRQVRIEMGDAEEEEVDNEEDDELDEEGIFEEDFPEPEVEVIESF